MAVTPDIVECPWCGGARPPLARGERCRYCGEGRGPAVVAAAVTVIAVLVFVAFLITLIVLSHP